MSAESAESDIQMSSQQFTDEVYKWLCQAYQQQIFSLGKTILKYTSLQIYSNIMKLAKIKNTPKPTIPSL